MSMSLAPQLVLFAEQTVELYLTICQGDWESVPLAPIMTAVAWPACYWRYYITELWHSVQVQYHTARFSSKEPQCTISNLSVAVVSETNPMFCTAFCTEYCNVTSFGDMERSDSKTLQITQRILSTLELTFSMINVLQSERFLLSANSRPMSLDDWSRMQ